ncbi:MAG: tetratricopeptide repeat protein [Acidobacteriota bacterium]
MSLFRRDSQQTAEKLVAKGKIEGAIKEYKKLLGKTGDDPTTLNRVGDLYVRLRKNEEAISFYTKTAEKYAGDGFYVKAIAVYKKIHRIEPTQIEVHRKLAELYQRQGLKNDARNHYSQLSDHYLREGDTTSAIDVSRKLVDLEPDNPSHHLKLADLHRENGSLSEALRSYGAIASLMLSHGQVDHAFQVYERAIGVDPSDLAFAAEAVSALKGSGAEDKAVALVELSESLNAEAASLRSLISEASAAEPEPAPAPPADEPAAALPEDDLSATGEHALELDLDVEEPLPSLTDSASHSLVAESFSDPEPAAEPEAPQPTLSERAQRDPVSGEWTFQPEPELEEPEFELELDLDFDGDQPLEIEEEAAAIEPAVAEPAPLEPAAPPVAVEKPSREAELLSEADVFFKYGLTDKGVERLEELLEATPDHAEALRRLIPVLVERGEEDRVLSLATSLWVKSNELSEPDAWNAVQTTLAGAGYRFEADAILAPIPEAPAEPPPVPATEAEDLPEPVEPVTPPADMIDAPEEFSLSGDSDEGLLELDLDEDIDPGELLADLADDEPAPTLVEPPPPVLETPVQDVDEIEAQLEEFADARESAPPSQEPALEPTALDPLPEAESLRPSESPESEPELELDLDLDADESSELEAEPLPPLDPEPAEAAPVEEASAEVQPVEESLGEEPLAELEPSTDWLDNAPETSDKLFDDEKEFFDLAAALEGEIDEPEPEVDETVDLPSEGDQSLDDIVEGFKRGVSENISDEDSDTHYNLGIAYREMMLLDEAIGEFQISARDSRYLVDSCAMLGLCFRDKGLPDLAVKWYLKALAEDGLPEEQKLGMLYDLGTAYEDMGEPESALSTFSDLAALSADYRDVSSRIAALQA